MGGFRSGSHSSTHRRRTRHMRRARGFCFLAVAVFAVYLVGSQLPFVRDRLPLARTVLSALSAKTAHGADETLWCLILVNRWNRIPDDYQMELTELSNGQSVDSRIVGALQEMFDAAQDHGFTLSVRSGYRTAEMQQILFDEKVAEYRAQGCSEQQAMEMAQSCVAAPGNSEHQLGISVDLMMTGLTSPGTGDRNRSGGYTAYDWLDQNSWRFGFIHRYKPDKTEITGIVDEPWHYRYVGVDAATRMYRQGICLEEYLGRDGRTGDAGRSGGFGEDQAGICLFIHRHECRFEEPARCLPKGATAAPISCRPVSDSPPGFRRSSRLQAGRLPGLPGMPRRRR